MDQFEKIDYRNLIDKESKEAVVKEDDDVKQERASLLIRFKVLDKKTKVEFLILICALFAIVASLVFYFIIREPSLGQGEFYAPPAEEEF